MSKSNLLRKILTILLIISLAAPFAVPFLFLHHQRKQVKKEVKEMIIAGMSKEDLVLLAFSREETETKLSWHHSREFEFEGEMFDIVETAFRGDSVFYWCWHDTEETNIGKQIDDLAARTLGGDPQKKEQQQRFVNLMKVQFLACGYSPGLTPDPGSHFTLPEHPTDYVSVSFQPLTPPPKFS